MLTAVVSIIVFGLLIGIHEAGHLIAAKLNKVTVHEYAIGMGPKLFSFDVGGTTYSLRLIPIGGYCKMEGEDEESSDNNAFCNKKAWQKFTIIVAGAAMNLVLGFIALCILYFPSQEIATTYVGNVLPNTPAYESGLQSGDKILKINNTGINIFSDVKFFLSRNGDKEISLTVLRNNKKLVLNIKPYKENNNYYIGFENKTEKNSFYLSTREALYSEIFISKVIFITFGDLFTGGISIKETSGPVGIVSEIGKAAKVGFMNVIYLIALISINLGLFNLLPLPALDGGRAVFSIFEMITKKKAKAEVEGTIHMIGFLLLLVLMLFVTFNDITKFF